MADVAMRVCSIHHSVGYILMDGKYQVVQYKSRFIVRDITTGERVETYTSRDKAYRRADYLNNTSYSGDLLGDYLQRA